MSEKVVLLGLARDPAFLHFVRDGAVWRIPRDPRARPSSGAERLSPTLPPPPPGCLYFLDGAGDIAVIEGAALRQPSAERRIGARTK